MRRAAEYEDEKCMIVLELLAGEYSCEEIGRRWGISRAELAEIKELTLGVRAAIADLRNGDGFSVDGPARGNGSNPLGNLGSEIHRQWVAALVGAFVRSQGPNKKYPSSHAKRAA